MTKQVRKAFDFGIAAIAAVVILNFAASSFGLGHADAQETSSAPITSIAAFKVASFTE